KLLALHLPRRRDARPPLRRSVERGSLMGILAISQELTKLAAESGIGRRGVIGLGQEPLADRRIVGSGASERLGSERFSRLGKSSPAMGVNFRQHRGI